MRIDDAWINDCATQDVMQTLAKAGHQAYFVGGCVRNSLLGLPATDIDISTNAHPETILKLGEVSGFKSIPTGIEHGTITWVAAGASFEITTFRQDIETSGRRAVVAFTDRIEDDAMRRDFTMNAIYADASGAIVDPLNGLEDLKSRRLKFIGNAEDRIKEDYLRILRFFRFFAYYADQTLGFDADGLAACAANSEGLELLSKERITQEIVKLFSAEQPQQAIATMAQTGILARIMPGATAAFLGPYLENELSINWLGRLFVLSANKVDQCLRLSKSETRQLRLLTDAQKNMLPLHEISYRFGAQNAEISGTFRESLAPTGNWNASIREKLSDAEKQIFPIKSNHFNDLKGKALGQALRKSEDRWNASDFKLSKDALLSEYQ